MAFHLISFVWNPLKNVLYHILTQSNVPTIFYSVLYQQKKYVKFAKKLQSTLWRPNEQSKRHNILHNGRIFAMQSILGNSKSIIAIFVGISKLDGYYLWHRKNDRKIIISVDFLIRKVLHMYIVGWLVLESSNFWVCLSPFFIFIFYLFWSLSMLLFKGQIPHSLI